MIEQYYNKMLEYLTMETEISFKEFDSYYKEVVEELANYKEFTKEQGLQALFIMDNLKSNSDSRIERKFNEAKKYKKVSERCKIWVEAIFLHLTQLGMTDKEITETIEQMYEQA